MDLSTFAIIIIVFLVSLLSMLLISRFPRGKTFEEMLKEKREMREKILGVTTGGKPGKETANKKTKKLTNSQGQKGRPNNKQQQQQQQQKGSAVKDSDQDSAEVESDSNASDSSQLEEEINPLTYAKKRTTTLGVEYVETEAFPLSDGQGNKKKDSSSKQGGGQGKKNKQKAGILVNKSEPVLVAKQQETVPEVNHFEDIHPKDAVEIARQHKHEEEIKTSKAPQQPKEQRNKNKKEQQPKASPKNSGVEVLPAATLQPVVVAPIVAAVAHTSETKSVANIANKEKSNKKKKNELITQQLAAEVHDAANVQSLVSVLSKADLPRNDIQILIDFLLNKQQDTLAKDPSEWNDPSDPLQKLKKQLQEKETQLLDEQRGAAGLQAKLKELRQELNNEKVNNSLYLKGYVEELNNKKQEVLNLSHELQVMKDKMANEKQTLSLQYQQLHAKYIQLSKEHAATQDHGSTIAQLNNDLQLLQQELMSKSQLLNEKLQSEEELITKKTEYEILLHNNDELIRQHVQKLAAYENDIRQLRAEVNQNDELSKTCQQQSYDIDQLKAQNADLQVKQKQVVAAATAAAAAAANNHAEETSRVEIRNLQNALDSTKTKLEVYRNEVTESKNRLTDYEQQTLELKAKEEQLKQQLEEQRQKNDNLRTKNWKLVEALQDAERKATNNKPQSLHKVEQKQQQLEAMANHVEPVDVAKVVREEQNKTKDLLVKLLPQDIVSALPLDATNFQSWLESAVTCINEQHELAVKRSTSTVPANSITSTVGSDSSSRSSSNIVLNNNSLHENNDSSHDEGTGISTKNGDADISPEEQQTLVLRNEQLQKTVDQYKTIIADTENMLKNLEAKVIEQDTHWRSVVQAKDKELTLLKTAGALQ